MFPLLSVAWHVTNACPMETLLPDAGLQVTVGWSPELSVALGCCQTATANGCPGSVTNSCKSGHVNSGFSLSKNVHTKSCDKQQLIKMIHLNGSQLAKLKKSIPLCNYDEIYSVEALDLKNFN